MKSLIAAALMMVSFSTFSSVEMGTVDSLLSVLPLGTHSGMNDQKEACAVTVNEVNFPANDIFVTVTNNKTKIFKIIKDGSEFLFRPYKKEFIQTDRYYVDSSRSSYVERIIRTVNAGNNRLYVVVANEITVNRERSTETLECVVNL